MTKKQLALFLHNLEMAIKFHDVNQNDPHGIGNAVRCALLETKNALELALKGVKQPEPKVGR